MKKYVMLLAIPFAASAMAGGYGYDLPDPEAKTFHLFGYVPPVCECVLDDDNSYISLGDLTSDYQKEITGTLVCNAADGVDVTITSAYSGLMNHYNYSDVIDYKARMSGLGGGALVLNTNGATTYAEKLDVPASHALATTGKDWTLTIDASETDAKYYGYYHDYLTVDINPDWNAYD
ncbi:hypothetical protein [Thaumasiovibrio sp. DFM-14]|uniref:hypothetical protein n=1 Tax=Thaumasiovibrio sp. DFM-14 TaxID=3384792 RepID=UPI0039A192AE